MSAPSLPADTLERIYRAVPDVRCKGHCYRTCGPIEMSDAEARRITERHGSSPQFDANLTCDKLKEKRCSIYPDRPLICRLWGATKNLQCPWGCRPGDGLLTEVKSRKLLARAERLLVRGNE